MKFSLLKQETKTTADRILSLSKGLMLDEVFSYTKNLLVLVQSYTTGKLSFLQHLNL